MYFLKSLLFLTVGKNHASLWKEDPNYVYNKACIRLLITESVHTKIKKYNISKDINIK